MPGAEPAPDLHRLSEADLATFFAPFARHKRVLLAVSGGPDSTALLLLARRWGLAAGAATELHVATVDHGLRAESRAEAEAVGALAARLSLSHVVLTLPVPLPKARLQEAARDARYEALVSHARALGAGAVATAHTLDDQAETVLFRLIRGSGIAGLSGMAAERELADIRLLRPLLGLPKAMLVGVCRQAGVAFVEDPSNRNPRFARVRLRTLLPELAAEGLDAPSLARLAQRMARAEAALEAATDGAQAQLWPAGEPFHIRRDAFAQLPDEIGLRLLGRAVSAAGEGVVELGKLEVLHGWIAALGAEGHGARTLAGAVVRVNQRALLVGPAPARRLPQRSR